MHGDRCPQKAHEWKASYMQIYSVNTHASTERPSVEPRPCAAGEFSQVLGQKMAPPRGVTESPVGAASDAARTEANTSKANPLISLGAISQSNPTVSNLLIRHPVYGKDCWRIIHSEPNRNKPYTRIQPGTTVYLNPETLEISWHRKSPPGATQAAALTGDAFRGQNNDRMADEPDSFSTRLVKAVKPYLGRAYEEFDCYELLIQGLKELGVRYHGRGGLKEQLLKTALQEQRPANAYLTGEGLIEVSGATVYLKRIAGVEDSGSQARELFQEIEPLLNEGLILSFSTPTRGHTGLVSRSDNSWTFINSGMMDNPVGTERASKGVGEEFLNLEINNWFRRAAARKESLQVTLGRLSEKKLIVFDRNRSMAAERA